MSSSKKRKLYLYSELQNQYRGGDVNLPENSASHGAPGTSGCSKHCESSYVEKEKLDSRNRKVNVADLIFSRERWTSGKLEEVSMASSSKSKKKSSATVSAYPKISTMLRAPEVEEFFVAAEKYEQKRFAEKYNYDIAKDVPLEGRYKWVRLKP
ncbi:Cyclin-dependent kinase inhibitor [Abeliophyllum distichum]|uniref:Cyclin-dependent kinase inhibitor n=1 Tax=Abeliophyllum distichum TaxID=126358 RepID=A0ABD1RQP8_9LAMI